MEIAAYLAQSDIPATFFVVGRHVREFPEDVDRIRHWGHTAANHTFNHPHLTDSFLSISELVDEVSDAALQFGPTGEPAFFRPPYGAWSPRLAHFLNRDSKTRDGHFGPVNWDIGGFDFEYWLRGKSTEDCAAAYLTRIRRRRLQNGIVLFHDRSADLPPEKPISRTLELVQILVPALKREGFRFAALTGIPAIQTLL